MPDKAKIRINILRQATLGPEARAFTLVEEAPGSVFVCRCKRTKRFIHDVSRTNTAPGFVLAASTRNTELERFRLLKDRGIFVLCSQAPFWRVNYILTV